MLLGGVERVEATHEASLAVGSLVLVDDTLGRSFVDPLNCQTYGFGILFATYRCHRVLGPGLDLRAHSLVRNAKSFVLTVALDLTLDVCHEKILGFDPSGHPDEGPIRSFHASRHATRGLSPAEPIA